MHEVTRFLRENPIQYLATVGRDGAAKCRPFLFCFELCGNLWFCTNSTKEVYREMQANPHVEFCSTSPAGAWIRLSGKAVFRNNIAVKEGCMKFPNIQSLYKEATNPIFEVFYLDNAKAVIADFSGDPPQEYIL
jgi:uncharacterized pyridoxamine 5'-phosphate oxidase family protein